MQKAKVVEIPRESCQDDAAEQARFQGRLLRVLALSLAIRVAWAGFAHFTPVSDFAYYHGLAENLLDRGTYQWLDRQAWVPPAYPLFLAGIYSVLGRSELGYGMVQAVLGAGASGLVVILAARVFSRRVGLGAGCLHAVAPNMVVYVSAQASENLAAPLMLAMLLTIDSARRAQGRSGWVLAAGGGGLFGLLLLTRPAMLFMAPACGLLLLASRRWSLVRPAVFAAMVGAALVPWTLRNYHVGLGFMPFTSSGGAGLYIANNDESRNGQWGDVSRDVFEGMSEKERSRAYREAVHKWIRQNFGQYARLCRVRLTRLLGAERDEWMARLLTPTYQNDLALHAEFDEGWEGKPAPPELRAKALSVLARNRQIVFWLNVLFLSPVGFVALALAVANWRKTALVLVPLLAYIAGLCATIANMRYRAISDPLLHIFVAALLCDLLTGSRELGGRPGRFAKLAMTALAIVGSTVVHATGWADPFYQVDPLPAGNPSVAGLSFQEAELSRAHVAWENRTHTEIARQDDGLHCVVAGTSDTSAAQYGGIELPANGCEAARLELSLVNPEHIVNVFVDLADSDGHNVARWQWLVAGKLRPAERRGTYVFLSGKRTGRFAPELKEMKPGPARLHVFLEVRPQERAGFILHRVETGTARVVPKLHFRPVALGRATASWVTRTRTAVSLEGGEVRCRVAGAGDTSGAQYGGLLIPVDPCEALGLDVSLINPRQVRRLFVELSDLNGATLARWQEDINDGVDTATARGRYLLYPGLPVDWFMATRAAPGTAANMQVFVEITPNAEAGFVVHAAETGRPEELPGHEFVPVSLDGAKSAWVLRTQTVTSRSGEGLNCRVTGTADTSAAQYGGFSVPVDSPGALRLDIDYENPEQILSFHVDLADSDGQPVTRWQWRPVSSSRGLQVLVPGQGAGRLPVEMPRRTGSSSEVQVFLEVSPNGHASFTLHRLEVARPVKPESIP